MTPHEPERQRQTDATRELTAGSSSRFELGAMIDLFWAELAEIFPDSFRRRPDGRYPLLIAGISLTFGFLFFLIPGDHRFGEGLSPGEVIALTWEFEVLGRTAIRVAIVVGTIGYFIRALSFIGAAPKLPRSGGNAPNP